MSGHGFDKARTIFRRLPALRPMRELTRRERLADAARIVAQQLGRRLARPASPIVIAAVSFLATALVMLAMWAGKGTL